MTDNPQTQIPEGEIEIRRAMGNIAEKHAQSKTNRNSRWCFGLAIMLVATSFAISGFKTPIACLIEGWAQGIGFMLMVWP
jgi:hypothetical protein